MEKFDHNVRAGADRETADRVREAVLGLGTGSAREFAEACRRISGP
ncbi:hypothetical protein [Sciscionella sediminilitoris]|nr:hypothetical protein [Sciscionella sp. SE31]